MPAPEFFGIVPVAAVSLLALNDAFFKAAFHNTLTGKLSDLAGCLALPLFLSALLSFGGVRPRVRIALGAVATLVFFTAIKVSSTCSALVCQVLAPVARQVGVTGPLHIVADPTDLVALLMIPLAVGYAHWALRAEPSSGDVA